jgi:hypothetical protein
MKRPSCFASACRIHALAGSTLALLAFALPAVAQAEPTPQNPASTNLVAFKGILRSVTPDAMTPVPTDPPVVTAVGGVSKGESALFGPITATQHLTIHLGADGNPLFLIGESVWRGNNGDALSLGPMVILVQPPSASGIVTTQGAFTIRSGRGRFLGATGSGILRGEVDLKTGMVTVTVEGMVTRPK